MKKPIILIAVIIVFAGFLIYASLKSPEETDNGQMLKEETGPSQERYNWSQMNQGPYQDKISFAVSSDLLNWEDQKIILAEHASVPDAVYKDGRIFLYFVDVSTDGIPEQTGLLRSNDNGQTWEDKVIVNYTGLGDKVPVDPCPVLLDDGRIRLYFLDINSARGIEASGTSYKNKIYSAISSDGINFTLEKGVRFEYEGIFDPDVIKVGETWYMYTGSSDGSQVLLATSKNGLDFSYEQVVYTGGAIPEAHFASGTFYLFTVGIEIATSSDGKNFAKSGKRFQSEISPLTADPSVIELDNGSFILFYKTK